MTGFAEDTAPAYEAPMTKTQFLQWVQGQQGCRYELEDGQAILEAAGSRNHALVIGRFIACSISSLDEPMSWAWQRGGEARSFPQFPVEAKGREAEISVGAHGLTLPLSHIYRGIGPA